MESQFSKYNLLNRIIKIQKERSEKPYLENTEERVQKAIQETQHLTVREETPQTMFTKCSVMGIQTPPTPLPGWSQAEANSCIPFLQRWNECMKNENDSLFISELRQKIPIKSIQSLDLRFHTFLSKFYSIKWDAVIVLVGSGSYPEQILLTAPDLSHELQGDKILILNCDKDHVEFKENTFNLYEVLEQQDTNFLNEMAHRFNTEYCDVTTETIFGIHAWTVKCIQSEDRFVYYVIAQTEWNDDLSGHFLPTATRKVLVDVTNRPAKFMPTQLASMYDAIYIKSNKPVDSAILGSALSNL
jgi:hypothetical protein